MIQSFQCPACGNFNAIGEPACAKCGQFFQYNCPVCGNPVDNRYLRCGTCNTLFNWNKPIQHNAETTGANIQQARLPYSAVQKPALITRDTNEIPKIKEKRRTDNLPLASRPVFWLILMIGCAVLIAILLFIARIAGI